METCSDFLRNLITAVYLKDRKCISKTAYCNRCSVVCKIAFCSEFPDIPDNAGRVTRRRRTQAIAKRYAFHANAFKFYTFYFQILKITDALKRRFAQLTENDWSPISASFTAKLEVVFV